MNTTFSYKVTATDQVPSKQHWYAKQNEAVFLSFFLRCLPQSVYKPYVNCGNKMPTKCNRRFLTQILLLAQHVSGTIMPINRSSRVLYSWLLPVVFGALVFKLSVWCGAEGCVSGLQAAALKQQHPQLHIIPTT